MAVALEIVSPEKLLMSRNVDMVVIPASEGDIGVLEGHSPMIVMLRGGTIDLYEGDKVTDRLFVGSGFAEITPERCTVLANQALPLDEVKKAEAAYEAADKKNPAVEEEAMDRVQSAWAMVEVAS